MTALPRALLVSSRANAIASSSRSVVPSLQSVSRRPSLPHRSPRVHFAFCKYASNSFGATSSSQPAHIPVIRSLAQLRRWRRMVRDQGLEVGVVPTMGALHQGHLDLVKASLSKHPFTVMTLFVNPMQFAPTEDLAAYPRTLERDLDLLRTLLPVHSGSSGSGMLRGLGVSENDSFRPAPVTEETEPPVIPRPVKGAKSKARDEGTLLPPILPEEEVPKGLGNLVVFAPGPETMYPLKGDLQDLSKKRGVEVDVKGWGDVMEGASRPQFFKGVATVCTKLFNAVEPDHAYFGQKDIQQALLLKIMLTDLLLAHPLPENLHILPTTRDPHDHLALSSRNAYLSAPERDIAPILHRALSAAQLLFSSISTDSAEISGEEMISAATQVILDEQQRILDSGSPVELRMDYIEVFDRHTFEPVRGRLELGREVVVAGAAWVGKTRLIDNLLLGWGIEDAVAPTS
ncbi:putative PAN6 Pantoate-beta-alanine ligase [Dioszegia hungarica]|uniref:Pantoate--beta-alanine ligase n=1 Tax=Dioszegia hungarica TaxID=4972 RepID=A0AA38H6J2_9TREE|nr:putative PAN6 Pantoate-beta-alanine ligase [Dioszegia hungarica]KAI9635522.1 putative PAN6 Pantoate-beta-alanine ligase [Dioszegia hungarica]